MMTADPRSDAPSSSGGLAIVDIPHAVVIYYVYAIDRHHRGEHDMTKYRRRPLPKKRCEAIDAADFGYGPTEYHECTRPATHRAKFVEPDHGAYMRGIKNPSPISGKFLLCPFHAKDHHPDSGPYGSIGPAYRFRTL